MYLVALGEGGIKPCVIPFGADQFSETGTLRSSLYWWCAANAVPIDDRAAGAPELVQSYNLCKGACWAL